MMLQDKNLDIKWIPCVAHCFDLMLMNIEKLESAEDSRLSIDDYWIHLQSHMDPIIDAAIYRERHIKIRCHMVRYELYST